MDHVEIKREEELFREVAVKARRKSRIPEKLLADINNVDPSQVSRWFSYTGNQQFPAFRLRFNPSELVIPILKDIALKHNHILVEVPDSRLNGQISDEVFELAARVGRLAEEAKDGRIDLEVATELFTQIIDEANKGMHEVSKMKGKKLHRLNHGAGQA